MSTSCPFCRNSINSGASVCGYCNAFLSCAMNQSGPLTPIFYIFMWGNYLLFGPIAFVGLLVSYKGRTMGKLYDLLDLLSVTGAITVLGFIALRWFWRFMSQPRWYRRNCRTLTTLDSVRDPCQIYEMPTCSRWDDLQFNAQIRPAVSAVESAVEYPHISVKIQLLLSAILPEAGVSSASSG